MHASCQALPDCSVVLQRAPNTSISSLNFDKGACKSIHETTFPNLRDVE